MDLLLKRRRIIASQRGEDTDDYTKRPLTFKCLTGGDLSIKNANTSYDRNFEYSLNGGAWTAFDLPKSTASKLIATLSPDDTIRFRRDNENFVDAKFISDSNLTFDIYGNLLSLLYGSAFNGQTELRNKSKKTFGAIFKETGAVDASNLMLTASTLSSYCYQGMFQGCTSLTTTPELPATTLAEGCYKEMFDGCTSLTTAPELPATALSNNCYNTMFRGCSSLLTAPELPVATLANNCYSNMFRNCTSLLTAPELPAATIASASYQYMFEGCSQLSYVKCLATGGIVYNNIGNWLRYVSNTGTFVKASGATWKSGESGIPNGWTVIEE